MRNKNVSYGLGILLLISCATQPPQTAPSPEPSSNIEATVDATELDNATLSSDLRPSTKGQRLPAADEGSLELEVVIPSGINTELVASLPFTNQWFALLSQPAWADSINLSEDDIKSFVVTADENPVEHEVLDIQQDPESGDQIVAYRLNKLQESVNVVVDVTSPSGTIELSRIIDEVKPGEIIKVTDRIDAESTAVTLSIEKSIEEDPEAIPLKELSFEDIREQFGKPEIKELKKGIINAFQDKSNKARKFIDLPFIKKELQAAKRVFNKRDKKRRRKVARNVKRAVNQAEKILHNILK